MSEFVYKRRSPEQFNTVMNSRGGGFDSYLKREFKVYKMKEGRNMIRFLPPTWEPNNHYAFELFVNYDVGPDKQSYLSLSRMGKGRDPLAEARLNLPQDKAKKLSPSRRWIAWVIDRDAPEEGPQLFTFPNKLNSAIMGASQDEDTREIVYVDDPKEGADIRFHKIGTGLNTEYPGEKIKLQKPSPLSEDRAEAKAWLEWAKAHPIPECLQFYSYEHISAVFNGAGAVEEEEEAPPAEQAPWKGKSKFVEEDDEPVAVAAKHPRSEPEDLMEDDTDSIRRKLQLRRKRLEAEED